MKENREILKAILSYIGKYKIYLFLSLVFALVSVVLSLYIPILVGTSIDFMIGEGRVAFQKLYEILMSILLIIGVTSLLQWLMNEVNNRLAFHVVKDIRNDAFQRLVKLPLSYLDRKAEGDIVSRIISDADQLSEGLLMGFTSLFTGLTTIFVTLIFMFRIDVLIALVVVVLTPISLVVAQFIAKRTFSYFKLQSEIRGEQTDFINENIKNHAVIKAFGREERSIKDFSEGNKRLEKASLDAIFYSSITHPATRFVNNLVYAGVGVVGAFQVINGRLTVGGITGFLAYANSYTKPFNEISGVITEFQNAIACAGRLLDLIHEKEEVAEEQGLLEEAEGKVEIKNVSFSYDKEKKLIESLNLSVKKGEHIAIVGPTGCGKTTLINLLMRFYDVDGGGIEIDGKDIRTVTRKSLRSSFGMVLQETWLKKGTIRENIAFGKPSATDEEIIKAAKATHAHSFIKKLKKGYDTEIDEGTGLLSAGQKQLLCITRVMLALPPMLILDEATSSIDTRTELQIGRAFHKMMKGRTSFIVAHRLSTIQDADVILVMRDGNIIEQGSHEELLLKKGFYYELYHK